MQAIIGSWSTISWGGALTSIQQFNKWISSDQSARAGGPASVPVRCLDATTKLRVEQAIRSTKLLHVQNAGLGSAFNVVGSLRVVQGRVNSREVQSAVCALQSNTSAAARDCDWGGTHHEGRGSQVGWQLQKRAVL